MENLMASVAGNRSVTLTAKLTATEITFGEFRRTVLDSLLV